MGFPRQEYWSGLLFPSPGDLPDPGIKPESPALQVDLLLSQLYIKSSECILFITLCTQFDLHFPISPPPPNSYDNQIARLIPNLCFPPHHKAHTQNGINLYFSRRENSSEILQSFALDLSNIQYFKETYCMLIKEKNYIIISVNKEKAFREGGTLPFMIKTFSTRKRRELP